MAEAEDHSNRGIVDASLIGLDSIPVAAAKDKFKPENHPKADTDYALCVHSTSNQHNERRYEFCRGYKSHVWVNCIPNLGRVRFLHTSLNDIIPFPPVVFNRDFGLWRDFCAFCACLGEKRRP